MAEDHSHVDARQRFHDRLKADARDRLAAIVRDAVANDAHYETVKPDVLKQIEAALDEHIFRPLFT